MAAKEKNRIAKRLPLIALLLLLLVASLVTHCSRGPERRGTSYPSPDALVLSQQQLGFVRVGSFGNSWPARIVEVRTSRDRLQFQRADGSRHSYNGFDGYTLKLIRLQGDGGEVIMIFRSNPTENPETDKGSKSPVRVI